MRKLAMALLLSATLPAFASVEADFNNGSTPAQILAAATANCEAASCAELAQKAVAELIAAGADIKTVIEAATASGSVLSAEQVVATATVAAVKAGKSVADVKIAAQDAGVSDAAISTGFTVAATDPVIANNPTVTAELVSELPATAAEGGDTVVVADNTTTDILP